MTLHVKNPPAGPRPPYVVAWFGADVAGAVAPREPDGIFAISTANLSSAATEESERTFDITLGIADDHERSGTAFGCRGRYCFALAWANALGEIVQRSPPTCLDTTKPADPLVDVDEKGACICVLAGRRTVSAGR